MTSLLAHPGLRKRVLAHHAACLFLFTTVVLLHWAEHLAQAFQIYVLGWPLPDARGLLGLPFPWLVSSETMHYGYALVMLLGLWLLRSGFTGDARRWWMLAFGLQFWHHFEHLLLFTQAVVGKNLTGGPGPASLLQLVVPRVELHLFYNTVVSVPMLVAMVVHLRRATRAAADVAA